MPIQQNDLLLSTGVAVNRSGNERGVKYEVFMDCLKRN